MCSQALSVMALAGSVTVLSASCSDRDFGPSMGAKAAEGLALGSGSHWLQLAGGAAEELESRFQDAADLLRVVAIEVGMHPDVRLLPVLGSLVRQQTLPSEETFRFTNGRLPYCLEGATVHRLADGKVIIQGEAPDARTTSPARVPEGSVAYARSLELAANVLRNEGHGPVSKILREELCLIVEVATKESIAVWDLSLVGAGMPFRVFVDTERTYGTLPLYFTESSHDNGVGSVAKIPQSFLTDGVAIGYSRVFERNQLGNMRDFTFSLHGKNKLKNAWVDSLTDYGAGATSLTNEFNFEPKDARFRETSLFTHANWALYWFSERGAPVNPDNSIAVAARSTLGGTSNNARYIPAAQSDSGHALVEVAPGDGSILQFLHTDADVVRHEVSHHVVIRKLTGTTGQALTLHEGLADFFAQSMASDPCFGASICPFNAPDYRHHGMCWVAARCLRTANNEMLADQATLGGDSTAPLHEGHIKGQVISGFLWDLRRRYGIPSETLERIAVKAIDYFAPNSGFRDFVNALVAADSELNAGEFREEILLGARRRHLIVR